MAHLQVFPPLVLAVALGDLWLEEAAAGHVGGQAGQGLPAATPHTNQHGIPSWLLQHSTDARQML